MQPNATASTSRYSIIPGGRPFAQELLGMVEQQLASPSLKLRFEARLEEYYEGETARARQLRIFWGGVVALACYNLFFIADRAVIPDVSEFMLVLRLGVITPASLTYLWLLRKHLTTWQRELLLASATLMVAGSLVAPLAVSNHANVRFCHATVLLAPILGNLMSRQRFPYAVGTSLLVVLAYGLTLPYCNQLSPGVWGFLLSVLVCAVLFTLYANYVMESESRRGYLYALRERIRRTGLVEQNAQLTVLASRDSLTGLANRREFDMQLEAALRMTQPVTLVMLDVDHFKAFNDSYGHQAGDDCLRRVGAALRQTARGAHDISARFGGEEFALILPGTEGAATVKAAERARAAVRALNIPHGRSSVASVVTVSVGVATSWLSATPSALVERADDALYRAKTDGRDRIWRYEGALGPSPPRT
jgi:diguanylate cyclase (GGDEF)-like protein